MDDWNRVKEAVDLVDVVSRYVPLKRAGTRMVGLCPFHAEKTPSFGIPNGQKFFMCFGCGKKGDVFSFVSEIERIDKFEALKRLADEAGITLSTGNSKEREERDRLVRVLADAQDLCRRAFESEVGVAARKLVLERKLTVETAAAFGIGYGPLASGSPYASAVITNRLVKAGHRREDVVAAGIASERDGGLADATCIRDRLTIPIRDERGRVIAFGGRRMSDGPDAPPAKYINTRETALFEKKRVLYGIDRARAAILKEERVVLVEGYMDVILAHQGGLTIAVAALGTSVTTEHARLLRQLARHALLFLDGDDAGQRAAERAVPLLLAAAIDVRVLVLKEDKDPGDYFARGATRDDFDQLLKRDGVAGLDFLLVRHGLRGAGSFDEKMQVARATAEALSPIEEPLAKKTALAHVARQLDLSIDALIAKFGRTSVRRPPLEARSPASVPMGGGPAGGGSVGAGNGDGSGSKGATSGSPGGTGGESDRKVPPDRSAEVTTDPAQVAAEQDLVTAMLYDPSLRESAAKLVQEGTIIDPVRGRLFRGLAASPAADAKQLVEGLLADFSGEPEAQRILLDLVDRRACAENAGKLFDGAIRFFERRKRQKQKDQLRADYRPRLEAGDATAAQDFLRDYETFRRSRGAS